MNRLGLRYPYRWLVPGLVVLALGACGRKGPPLPPEPRGPNPPRSVAARQIGDRAAVTFLAPAPRGGKPSQEMVRIELIRVDYAVATPPPPDPDAFRRRGRRVVELRSGAEPFAPGQPLVLEDDGLPQLLAASKENTLRYAVRVLDRRGRGSVWVAAPDLAPLAPGTPPFGLHAEPTAAGVRLTWEGEGGFGFNVYRSEPGGAPPLSPLHAQPLRDKKYLDESVEIGGVYVYTVRALLADGRPRRESASSEPAEVAAVDRFAPAAPRSLVAVQEGSGVRLFWDPSPERDVVGYRVYRSVDGAAFAPIEPGPVGRPLFLDEDVREGDRVRYRVTAVDGADPPNESLPAETETLTVAAEPDGTE